MSDMPALLAISGGAALVGLALLIARPSQGGRWRLVLALAAPLLAGLGVWAPAFDVPTSARLPLLALAAGCTGCVLLSSPFAVRLLVLAGNPRAQGVALLVGGPLLVLGWSWLTERDVARDVEMRTLPTERPMPPYCPEVHTAWTDRGAAVPLYEVAVHEALPADRAAETRLVQSRDLGLRLIRTGATDRASNCHGWVFSGGRYWIDAGDVVPILHDNGYEALSVPRAGDLAIYRDQSGQPVHSSLVRAVGEDGLVMVESKWSFMGRYIHRVEDYCFATSWTYYRSQRSGHLLVGVEGGPSEPEHHESAGSSMHLGE